MRKLTRRFLTSVLDKHEKATKESIGDILNKLGKMSISSMIDVIVLGNNNITREEASSILDDYLLEDGHDLTTAMLDLIEELDRDTKILRMTGLSVADFREKIDKKIKDKSKEVLKEFNGKDEEDVQDVEDKEDVENKKDEEDVKDVEQ